MEEFMVHQQNFTPSTYGYELNTANSEVQEVFNSFAQAIKEGDLDGIMSFYSDEIVAYDMMPPLEYTSKKTYRESWKKCFTDYFKFPVQFSYENQKISVSGDLAFANGFVHLNARSKDGEQMESWLRNTTCLKKFDGSWMITCEHQSVPLDENTMKGLMDLKPELH